MHSRNSWQSSRIEFRLLNHGHHHKNRIVMDIAGEDSHLLVVHDIRSRAWTHATLVFHHRRGSYGDIKIPPSHKSLIFQRFMGFIYLLTFTQTKRSILTRGIHNFSSRKKRVSNKMPTAKIALVAIRGFAHEISKKNKIITIVTPLLCLSIYSLIQFFINFL